MLELPPADAFDGYLVTAGLLLILGEWPRGASVYGLPDRDGRRFYPRHCS
jgi:uncharacterized protein